MNEDYLWNGGGEPDPEIVHLEETLAVFRHRPRVPLDGGAPIPFVSDYSVDPAWSPDGRFVAYSGPDIGTTFSVNVMSAADSGSLSPARTLNEMPSTARAGS